MGGAAPQPDNKDPNEKKQENDLNSQNTEKKKRRRRRRRRRNTVGEAVHENVKAVLPVQQNKKQQSSDKQDAKKDEPKQEEEQQPSYVYNYGQSGEPDAKASQPYYYPNQPDSAAEPPLTEEVSVPKADLQPEQPDIAPESQLSPEPVDVQPKIEEPLKPEPDFVQPQAEPNFVEPEQSAQQPDANVSAVPEPTKEPYFQPEYAQPEPDFVQPQPEPIQPQSQPEVAQPEPDFVQPLQEESQPLPAEETPQPIYVEQPYYPPEQNNYTQETPSSFTQSESSGPEIPAAPAEAEPVEGTVISGNVEEAPKESLQESTKPKALDFAEKTAKFFAQIFSSSGKGIWNVLKNIPGVIWSVLKKIKFGFIVTILILGGLGFGGYKLFEMQIPQKAYNSAVSFVGGFFNKKQAVVQGPQVPLNDTESNQFGMNSAAAFGKNNGSVDDVIPEPAVLALYFGQLLEPSVQGETGITAAMYFGLLKDQSNDVNDFVVYMDNLSALQDLYKVDVYALLDSTTKRADKIDEYIAQLEKAKSDSNDLLQKIQINMDDISKSYDSLNPDRSQAEKDFFDAMDQLKPEKANDLLHEFVDVAQKQVALKARVGGLKQLITYYQTALAKLDKRIEAVVKNREALIQGIHVVDVPGGGVNIIVPASN